jgi:hypothetical protein
MSERQIDEAIDDAVRDLMNVDADPAFRARVVERLRQPKSQSLFWRHRSLAGAAVAVVVIGAVLMMRSAEGPVVEQRPAAVATTVTRPPAAEPAAAAPRAPVGTRLPMPSAARRRPDDPTHQISRGALVATVVDEAPGTVLPEGVEPLSFIRPIELAPITPTPIVTTEIAIAPLAAPSELVIVPLTPQTARD